MRKPAFCICQNKDPDQLKLISAFVFATWIVQSLFYLNTKFQASSHLQWLYSMAVQPSLCGTRSKTPKTGFLTTSLILDLNSPESTMRSC